MWLAKSAGPDHGGWGRPGRGLLLLLHSHWNIPSPGSFLPHGTRSELQFPAEPSVSFMWFS